MKVSREKKGFQPITIVLETEEEALMMYLILGGTFIPIGSEGTGIIPKMSSDYAFVYKREEE